MSRTGGGRGTNQHQTKGVGRSSNRHNPTDLAPPPPIEVHAASLDASAIAQFFDDLAEELGDGDPIEIVVIGGAYMALTGGRGGTADIDASAPLSDELREAVERVARRSAFPDHVLNANAAPFVSSLSPSKAVRLHRAGRLTVYGPTPDEMLLLKLRASRPHRDEPDIVHLFPRATFQSVSEIVARFVEAFPEEPVDPHLDQHVAKMAQRSGVNLQMD